MLHLVFTEEAVQALHYERYHYHVQVKMEVLRLNARYRHCQLVRNLAVELNVELLFLPSYLPNLNLIER